MVQAVKVEETSNTVYWVDIKLAQQKGFKFYQNKIERNHPLRHTPSLLFPESYYGGPESYYDGHWRNQKTRKYMCNRSEVPGGSEDSQLSDTYCKIVLSYDR